MLRATRPPNRGAAGPDSDAYRRLFVRAVPLVAIQVLVFAAFVVTAGAGSAREMGRVAAVFLSFLLLSLLPLYAVHSNLYVSLDFVLYLYALFTVAATLVIQALIVAPRKLVAYRRSRSST
jgi:hypothetical protein